MTIVIEILAQRQYDLSMEAPATETRGFKDRLITTAIAVGLVALLVLAYAVYGLAFYHIVTWASHIF